MISCIYLYFCKRNPDYTMNRNKTFGTYRKVNIKQLLTSFCMFLLTMSMLIGCSRSQEKDKAIFEKEQLEKELKTLGRIDSLQRRLEQYRKEHNQGAMMLCYRFLGVAYRGRHTILHHDRKKSVTQ